MPHSKLKKTIICGGFSPISIYIMIFVYFLERNHTLQNTEDEAPFAVSSTGAPRRRSLSWDITVQIHSSKHWLHLFSQANHMSSVCFPKIFKVQLCKWHLHFNTNIFPFLILKFVSYMHRSNRQNLAQQILYRDEKHQNKIASLLLLWNHTHQP